MTDIYELANRMVREQAAADEAWIQSQMEHFCPVIARAVAKRQALAFCGNWLAAHGFRIVRKQGTSNYLGLSINGRIVAEREGNPCQPVSTTLRDTFQPYAS